MKTMFCFFQGAGFTEILVLLFLLPAFSFGLLIAVRGILLWYWKINTIIENQQIQIKLLQDMLITFNRNRS